MAGHSIDARVCGALEGLYRAFATPVPPVIEGCPCCLAKRGTDILLTTPLRELTGRALFSYVSGVFYTVGAAWDFRYFLPRIFDIAINDPGNSNDAEIVLAKLGLANWRSWVARERGAVETAIDAWFERVLAEDLAEAPEWIGSATESLLCGITRAGLPLAPWLARLDQPDAAPVLGDIRARFPGSLSAFWQDAPSGLDELSAFLAR